MTLATSPRCSCGTKFTSNAVNRRTLRLVLVPGLRRTRHRLRRPEP